MTLAFLRRDLLIVDDVTTEATGNFSRPLRIRVRFRPFPVRLRIVRLVLGPFAFRRIFGNFLRDCRIGLGLFRSENPKVI